MVDGDRFCGGCGAELSEPDGSGRVVCARCGRATRPSAPPSLLPPRPTAPPPPAAFAAPGMVAPPMAPFPPGADPDAARRSARRTWTIVIVALVGALLLAVLFVGAVIAVGHRDVAGSSGRTLGTVESTNVVLLDREPSQPVEALALERDFRRTRGAETVVRVRLDGSSGEDAIVWRAEPLADSVNNTKVLVAGDKVYIGADRTVRQLSLSTGKTLWTASLSDRLDYPCSDCFQLVGDGVAVRAYDGIVSQFGPDSPDPVWTHRLDTTSAAMFVVGDQVVVLDTPAGAEGPEAQALDARTGEIGRSTSLSCPDPDGATFGGRDQMLVVPGSDDLLAIFGSSEACAVRFDPSTGEESYSTSLPEGFDGYEGDAVVLDGAHLVADLASGLVSLDLADGKTTSLELLDDLDVSPLRIVGDTLVAETSTTRGTPRMGLAAFDLATGESIWSETLGRDQSDLEPMVDPQRPYADYGEPATQRVLVTGSGDDLLAVTFDDDRSPRVDVRAIDRIDGTLGEVQSRSYLEKDASAPVSARQVDLLVAQDAHLLVAAGRSLRLIPLPSGDVRRWPGG